MRTLVQGICVLVDPLLSHEQIHQLVLEVKQKWDWEGRRIKRIELYCVDEMVEIHVYEHPCIEFISAKNIKHKE